MKTITTYAEATSYIESLKALHKELHKQDKEVKEALLATEFIAKYDHAAAEAKALHDKLQDVLGSIGTQLQVSEEEMKKAKKVAWHLKKAEEVMASKPKLETEGKEG